MHLLCKAVLILLQDAKFATMLKKHWLYDVYSAGIKQYASVDAITSLCPYSS